MTARINLERRDAATHPELALRTRAQLTQEELLPDTAAEPLEVA